MSIKVMDMVADRIISSTEKKPNGDQTDKNVLSALANYASDCGSGIWASNQTVGDRAGVSRETAQRSIKRHIESGLLINDGTRKTSGTSFTRVYKIDVRLLHSLPLTLTAKKQKEYMEVTERHNQNTAPEVTLTLGGSDADTVSEVTERHTNRPLTFNESSSDETIDFEAFWKAYPFTTGTNKGAAFSAWGQLSNSDQRQALTAAKLVKKDDGFKYFPVVFLRRREFDNFSKPIDQPTAPVKGSPSRAVYDHLQSLGNIKAWNSWFAGGTEFDGEWFPKSKLAHDRIAKEFMPVLQESGLRLGAPVDQGVA